MSLRDLARRSTWLILFCLALICLMTAITITVANASAVGTRALNITPSGTGTGQIRVGLHCSSDVPITVDSVWWYHVTGSSTTVTVYVYAADQTTVLASKLSGTLADGWNEVVLDTPLSVAASTVFYPVVSNPSGDFRSQFGVFPLTTTDGHISITEAQYDTGAGGFPGSTWTGLHGMDFSYTVSGETSSPSPSPTPVDTEALLLLVKDATQVWVWSAAFLIFFVAGIFVLQLRRR